MSDEQKNLIGPPPPLSPKPISAKTPLIKRRRPTHVLPTDRCKFSKQIEVLRAYVAASHQGTVPVSNEDVGRVAGLHYGTVSICNPFFYSVGMLQREKNRYIPSPEVVAYSERFKWDGESAFSKLAGSFRTAWFSVALLPKLSFRQLELREAISFLADEAGVGPDFSDQLHSVLLYMQAAGLIRIDGGLVSVINSDPSESNDPLASKSGTQQFTLNEAAPQSVTGSLNLKSPSVVAGNEDRPQIDEVHPAIMGLILELPSVSDGWAMEDMNAFLTAFTATLKFIYKPKAGNGGGQT